MSLIKCKECGTEVSSSAFHCPKCGAAPAAMKGNQELYIVGIIVLILVLIVLGWMNG